MVWGSLFQVPSFLDRKSTGVHQERFCGLVFEEPQKICSVRYGHWVGYVAGKDKPIVERSMPGRQPHIVPLWESAQVVSL